MVGGFRLESEAGVHANIPFEKLPTDYLYNVINHGGAAMGKSPNMPLGLTIGQQGVADVMAYLKATFKGGPDQARRRWEAGLWGLSTAEKDGKGAARISVEDQSLAELGCHDSGGEDTLSADGTARACAMCHGEKGNGQGASWARR